MRKLTLAFLFCLFSTIANAQIVLQKPVTCDHATVIVNLLKDHYKESLVWVGTAGKTMVMLTVNTTTYTWTLLEIYDEIACILATGQKSNHIQNNSAL